MDAKSARKSGRLFFLIPRESRSLNSNYYCNITVILFRMSYLLILAVVRDGPQSVPFELLREQWNEYIFSDQVVVRTRLILIMVMREYNLGPLTFQTQRATTVSAPDYRRGIPGEFEQGDDGNKGAKWECPILLRYERWNEYSLADGTSRLRMIFMARKAFKLIDAFDKNGQPVYIIEGKPLIKVDDTVYQNEFDQHSGLEV